jgi:hypothetical protein
MELPLHLLKKKKFPVLILELPSYQISILKMVKPKNGNCLKIVLELSAVQQEKKINCRVAVDFEYQIADYFRQ